MESTGGSATKQDSRAAKEIPKEHFKYFPSIGDQGLAEKTNRKKL